MAEINYEILTKIERLYRNNIMLFLQRKTALIKTSCVVLLSYLLGYFRQIF